MMYLITLILKNLFVDIMKVERRDPDFYID